MLAFASIASTHRGGLSSTHLRAAAFRAGVEKVFWYTQVDDPKVPGWALGHAGQRALGIVAEFLTGSEPLGQFQGQDDRGRPGDDVYEYRFARDGETIVAIWKARGGDESRSVTIRDVAGDVVRVYDLDARDLSPAGGREIPVVDGTVVLDLTEPMIFRTGEGNSPNLFTSFEGYGNTSNGYRITWNVYLPLIVR
jgi:hypothetical protein